MEAYTLMGYAAIGIPLFIIVMLLIDIRKDYKKEKKRQEILNSPDID